jgi:hypothetical protein
LLSIMGLVVVSEFALCSSPKLLPQCHIYRHAWTLGARNGVFWGCNEHPLKLAPGMASHCRLPALSHRADRCLQPQRPPRANPGRCPLLLSVPPHQFRVKRRPRQLQRLLNAGFVLQPGRCLSLADDALSLPLVTSNISSSRFRSA